MALNIVVYFITILAANVCRNEGPESNTVCFYRDLCLTLIVSVRLLMNFIVIMQVTSYRGAISSLREQASQQCPLPSVQVDAELCEVNDYFDSFPSLPIKVMPKALIILIMLS